MRRFIPLSLGLLFLLSSSLLAAIIHVPQDKSTAVPPDGGTRVDIGAFEFTNPPPPLPPPNYRDTRDSIIIDSKTIAADSGTGSIVRLRVWITNKDTLANVSLPLEEKSVAGEAYMLPAHPRTFSGTVVRLTNTLPNYSLANYNRFNGVSPDSFVISSFYDPNDVAGTAEPPNAVRKPLWDILFDTVRIENPTGSVQFDTVRMISVSVGFVNPSAYDITVNFVKSIVSVYSRIPAMPLTLPEKDARVPLRRPTLVWHLPRDSVLAVVPASYRAVYSADSTFSIADSSAVLADTSWKVPVPLNWNQRYFWKAIGLTSAGDTIFSKPRAFTIIPSTFGLKQPSQDQVLSIRQPSFTWQKVRDTSVVDSFTYRLILSKDESFTMAETSAAVTDTAWKIRHRLTQNQTYFWKAMAVYSYGDTIFSASVGRFSTNFPSFSLTLPFNAPLQIRRPTFSWQSVTDTSLRGGFHYRVFLSKNSAFSPADTSPLLSSSSWKAPQILDFDTYYWKVRAVSDSGDTIASRSINFLSVRPPTLSLLLPMNGTRVFTKFPTFSWGAMRDTSIPDSFSYQVLVGKAPYLLGTIASPVLKTTNWMPSGPLEMATNYFWKVLPFYGSDTIILSDIAQFYLAPTRIEVPDDRPTIQEAIDITQPGDTVLVKPGVYFENIQFKGRPIKVIAQRGAEATTIAKQMDGIELVGFSGGDYTTTLLKGFTLSGAQAVPGGAAIKIYNASPRIENCRIVGNRADLGIIWAQNSAAKLRRNLIAKNRAQSAIAFKSYGLGEIINCTIADNEGDGIQIAGFYPLKVANNILAFNSGFGVAATGGLSLAATTIAPAAGSLTYNDVYGNSAGDYLNVSPGTGNLSDDPLFLNRDSLDYQIRGTSACRDAGDPASPVPVGGGSRVDMGAFEFVGKRGDLDGDGNLALPDVVLELDCVFVGSGNCSFNLTDIDCSGYLSAVDVIWMLNAIFRGTPLPC